MCCQTDVFLFLTYAAIHSMAIDFLSLCFSCLISFGNLIWILLSYLQLGIQRLSDYPLPFWLALFVEGTRFTQAKLLAAQEYATSTGLPVPRNVLIPRTKVNFIYFLPYGICMPITEQWILFILSHTLINTRVYNYRIYCD